MASVFKKRGRWWCRLKGYKKPGVWSVRPSPYPIGTDEDEQAALRYCQVAQKQLDARNLVAAETSLTVLAYAERWLAVRATMSLASHADDVGRIRNHVLPLIGHLRMAEVRPKHVRDMIRELRRGELANRTIISVNGVARTMFRDAVVDEVIPISPWMLKHGELPEKSDKDPEWRELAVYSMAEVVAIVTSPLLHVERRVQYALKALAGLRHGEVAGLIWRLYDPTLEPLGRIAVARSYRKQRTKTEVTRPVPVHPVLAAILASWRSDHWARVYGREPTDDDLIVPTRRLTCIDPSDAGVGFKEDLVRLGLRVDAGEHRARGGHDLRAWFISTALEHGASPEALARVTHTKRKDVMSGYTRLPWPTVCGAVSALRFVVDGDPLARSDQLVTRELSSMNRWKTARPQRDSKASISSNSTLEDAPSAGTPLPLASRCDLGHTVLVASLVTTKVGSGSEGGSGGGEDGSGGAT